MLFTCLQIFFARLVDVSLGTVRTIFIVNNKKKSAAVVAFFEVLIWFLVAQEALVNASDSIFIPIFYALGFSVGTYIGMYLSNKFIASNLLTYVITKKNNTTLTNKLRESGFGVSIIALKNVKDDQPKDLLFISSNSKSNLELDDIIYSNDKNAFVLVNSVKHVYNGVVK